jgi:hypothetical protein
VRSQSSVRRAAHPLPAPDPFDPAELAAALATVPAPAWSFPSAYGVTGVHHGYCRVELVSSGYWQSHAAAFRALLDRFAPVHAAWLSRIDAGGFIVPHRDAGPWRERWQVPLEPAGEFHGADRFTPTTGVPFQVEHWAAHAVANDTDHPRIHLVIDRDVLLDLAPEPFAVFPVPDDMAALVRRSLHAEDS